MAITINIKKGSKEDRAIKKYMANKAAFRTAIKNGTVSEFIKQENIKLDTPVPPINK